MSSRQRLMMRLVKNFVAILVITISLFLVCDFILSHIGVNPYDLLKRYPDTMVSGIAHPVYHHDLKPNLDKIEAWGPLKYRLCTNPYGFKVSCNNVRETRKDFDIAFMGDSFTESVGTIYEESFVGLYAQKHPDIAVANFGVRAYSPSIYFKKIEFLLNNGFTFNHLIVLPDISDIRDEAILYTIDGKIGSIVDNIEHIAFEESINEYEIENKIINSFHKMLAKHFKFTWFINCSIYDYYNDDGTGEKIIKGVADSTISRWTRDIDSPHYGKEGVLGGIRKNLEYMRRLKQLLDKHNIKMTVVVYPWPAQLFFEDRDHLGMQIWKDFCIKEGCYNFIDANPFFFDEIQKSSKMEVIKKYYIHGDVHFNTEGNKAMFAVIDNSFQR